MTSAIETNGEHLNATNWSRTRRVFVEHDIRPVNSNKTYVNGQSNIDSAIKTLTKQHQDEQDELKELNSKLLNYLEHVHDLETFNGQLLAELDHLREKWGNNTEQINRKYSPELRKLRRDIDDSFHLQIRHELQLEQYEYDIEHLQQRINAFQGDNTIRLNSLEQELANTINELEILKKHFHRRETELAQQRVNLQNLDNLFEGLENELLNQRLERILLQNEIQTLREEIAFEDVNYQVQRKEILTLNVPTLDLTKFYRAELTRAISDIRDDFEILFQSQLQELEEYYRIKTEEIKEEFEQDKERKHLISEENEDNTMSSMFSSLIELNDEYKQLKNDNNQLEIDLNDILDDLNRIREEQIRENEKSNLQFNQLQQEYQDKQNIINDILENNVSLRFELLTYRNLLKSEEKHVQRNEKAQEQSQTLSSSSPSPTSTPNSKGYSIQKLAVKKESKGSIVFDTTDFVNDLVIIHYDTIIGKNQSLEKWTLQRQNDQQSEIKYQFPASFTLKPRQKIRILSKHSPESLRTEKNVLLADHIETWGHGQTMITRLINDQNEEKASITETRLPT